MIERIQEALSHLKREEPAVAAARPLGVRIGLRLGRMMHDLKTLPADTVSGFRAGYAGK